MLEKSGDGGAPMSTPGRTKFYEFKTSFDPHKCCAALLGFPDSMTPSERIPHIEQFIGKFKEFKVVDYGTIYSGPKNDRKPTKHYKSIAF